MIETLVYCPGVWDLLHVGHVRFLQRARSLGSRLIVGVPTDGVVFEDKGRPPVICVEERAEMLRALRCVDDVGIYARLDFVPHLEQFRPRVLAVGEQWGGAERHRAAEEWMHAHGGRLARIPYTHGVSTTTIREKCRA